MELREMDLYPPLESFLTQRGYIVHAEVLLSDISATKEGELLVVEIKLRFNLDVILQAIQRQSSADGVYIAVPILNFKRYPKRWKEIRSLCVRLGIGVLFVRFVEGREPEVEVALHRRAYPTKKSRGKDEMLEEMSAREVNRNIGGSSRLPLFTAYRKEALRIARLLSEKGPLSPRQLRAYGCVSATGSILSKNYYGWFERVERGVYRLTASGQKALQELAQRG